MTDEQLAEIEARLKAATEMVSNLCEGRREWRMSIPARPDYDPDLVISAALKDIAALLAEVRDYRRIGGALLYHDERGQGVGWQEAMDELHKKLGEETTSGSKRL